MGAGKSSDKLVATALVLAQAGLVGRTYLLCETQPDSELISPLLLGRAPCHILCPTRLDPENLTAMIRRSPYDLLLLSRETLSDVSTGALDAALDEAGGQVLVVS